MKSIDNKEVIDFYNSHEDIWPEGDNWHKYTKQQLTRYVNKYIKKIKNDIPLNILNAGSGGSTYNLKEEMHHLDLTGKYISHFNKYTVGSVENMPFENESFNLGICVGSVLNYCNATNSISQLSKVISSKGYLILEFESSWSMEFYKSSVHKKNVEMAVTQYFNTEHKLWVYSKKYIHQILKQNDFKVIDLDRFHILSSYAYKYYKNENKAALFANFDILFRFIPVLSQYSHNIIMLCQKH